MIEQMIANRADLEQLKTAFANSMQVGPVAQIDAVKGYRLKLGDDEGEPYLSPWYPHPETGKTSVPLEIGQIVGTVNPSGDPRQGFMVRAGYSYANSSPNNDMEANVFEHRGVRISVSNGALVITIGGVTHTISAAGITTTGGRIEHDGLNIGSSHKHSGITPGGSNTNIPNP